MRRGIAGIAATAASRAAGLAVVWGIGLACAGLPFGPPRVHLENELVGAEAEAAYAMGRDLVSGHFPSDVAAACGANAARFTWLAARATDPVVVAASLTAAAGCPNDVQPDLAWVAAAALGSSDRAVLLGALRASSVVVATVPPEHPLLARLVALGTGGAPEVRFEAIEVLDNRSWAAEPLVSVAYLSVLHDPDTPWLVTEALRLLRYRAKGLADRDAYLAICRALASDRDPGIRGRAALVLARLAPDDPGVRELLIRMLEDPHGYTRSAAAEALADAGYVPAIHPLVARIDDPSKNLWDMLPYTRLDSTREVAHHIGSLHGRVDDAFLRAIVVLSADMGDDRFVYRPVNPKYWELDVTAASRDARKWYAAHAAEIPPVD